MSLNSNQVGYLQSILAEKVNRGVALVKLRESVASANEKLAVLQSYNVDIDCPNVEAILSDVNSAVEAMQAEANSISVISDIAATAIEVETYVPTELVSISQPELVEITPAETETIAATEEVPAHLATVQRVVFDDQGNETTTEVEEIIPTVPAVPEHTIIVTEAVVEEQNVISLNAVGRKDANGVVLTEDAIQALFDDGETSVIVQIEEVDLG